MERCLGRTEIDLDKLYATGVLTVKMDVHIPVIGIQYGIQHNESVTVLGIGFSLPGGCRSKNLLSAFIVIKSNTGDISDH